MSRVDTPVEYLLSDVEREQLQEAALRHRDSGDGPGHPGFYDSDWSKVDDLPPGLRRFLEGFRRNEPAAACLIHGFPLDDGQIGPTPGHWEAAATAKNTRDQEIVLALCGMALGEPFTWETLQAGNMIQNVLPIAGDELRQSGHGSETVLEFHTEDGFHPRRCDYLLLFGVRNDDAVPTLLASVRDLELDPETARVLAERRFHILPDDEHIRQLEARDATHPALAGMRAMRDRPEPQAVLFGHEVNPYLRIDRPFMRCVGDDPLAERALDALMAELERVQQQIAVGAGSLLVIDNHLAVHGRRPFRARYDGRDRWLKKVTVSRDLRRRMVDCRVGSHRVVM